MKDQRAAGREDGSNKDVKMTLKEQETIIIIITIGQANKNVCVCVCPLN